MTLERIFPTRTQSVSPEHAVGALRVAKLHLEACRSLRGWEGATPTGLYPIHDPEDPEQIRFIEVKVSTVATRHAGHVLVSVTEEGPAVRQFSVGGKTMFETLLARSGDRGTVVVWHGPHAASMLDQDGKTVATMGPKIAPSPGHRKLPKGYEQYGYVKPRHQPGQKRPYVTQKQQIRLRPLSHPAETQISVFRDIIEEEDRQFFAFKAVPGLEQFDLDNGERSGCGPTAWAALSCFHDLHYDPGTLYGSYGVRVPYVTKLIKKFHHALDTDDGDTWLWNMENGYDVVRSKLLQCPANSDIEWFAYGCNEVASYLNDMILSGHAAMVYYPTGKFGFYGHVALAVGLLDVYEEPDGGHHQYVHIHEEYGGTDLCYVAVNDIEGAWTIDHGGYSCLLKKTHTDIHSAEAPSMVALNDRLYTIWKEPNGRVIAGESAQSGYEPPRSGSVPEPFKLETWTSLPSIHATGAVSACGWVRTQPVLAQIQDGAMVRVPSEKAISWLRSAGISSSGPSYLCEDVPYLFFSWRDAERRIHISYTDSRNMAWDSVTDYVLPEAFTTDRDPTIGIVKFKTYDKPSRLHPPTPYSLDPVLCLAYVQDKRPPDYSLSEPQEIGGDSALRVPRVAYDENGNPYIEWVELVPVESASQPDETSEVIPGEGVLLLVKLNTFFSMASGGQDLWPRINGSVDASTNETGTIIDLRSAKFLFGGAISQVTLSTDQSSGSLAWVNAVGWLSFANFTPLGIGDQKRIEATQVSGTAASRPSILCLPYGKLMAWKDSSGRIMITDSSKGHTIIADMKETSIAGPALGAIQDTIGNAPTVLTWFGTDPGHSLNFRILYLGAGIGDIGNLPS